MTHTSAVQAPRIIGSYVSWPFDKYGYVLCMCASMRVNGKVKNNGKCFLFFWTVKVCDNLLVTCGSSSWARESGFALLGEMKTPENHNDSSSNRTQMHMPMYTLKNALLIYCLLICYYFHSLQHFEKLRSNTSIISIIKCIYIYIYIYTSTF